MFAQYKEFISHEVCNCTWSGVLEPREGWSSEEHERERQGPLRALSGSPEKRIMGLGCGVGLSLSGFDHTIASSVKQHKNSAGQNRLSPLLSHYAHHLSPHHSLFPFLISFLCTVSSSSFFLPAFLSLSPSLILSFFFFSFSSSQAAQHKMHTHTHTHSLTHTAPVLITRQYLLSYGLTGNGFNVGIASCQSMLFYSD